MIDAEVQLLQRTLVDVRGKCLVLSPSHQQPPSQHFSVIFHTTPRALNTGSNLASMFRSRSQKKTPDGLPSTLSFSIQLTFFDDSSQSTKLSMASMALGVLLNMARRLRWDGTRGKTEVRWREDSLSRWRLGRVRLYPGETVDGRRR